MKGTKKISVICCALLCSLAICSCSPANYISQEGLSGSLIGGAVGTGVGWLIGNEVGDKSKNMAANAAIGAGVGLLSGAFVNERNIATAKKREMVVREAKMISTTQRKLDKLREELYDSSSWGKNETETWDVRYMDSSERIPYQGPVN